MEAHPSGVQRHCQLVSFSFPLFYVAEFGGKLNKELPVQVLLKVKIGLVFIVTELILKSYDGFHFKDIFVNKLQRSVCQLSFKGLFVKNLEEK